MQPSTSQINSLPKPKIYFPELDSLRFAAFLLVLVHHGDYAKHIEAWRVIAKYGWIGVDLFLCVSAFLFTRLLRKEFDAFGRIDIRKFYIRRALRIWPLYFLFFSIMLFLSIRESGWNSSIQQRTLGMITFTDNLLSSTMGYNGIILFASHLWTISYEEQFYFIIPWVLQKFYRWKSSRTMSAISVFVLTGWVTRALMIYYQVPHPAVWVLPFTHFESIVGGMIVGLGLLDESLKKLPRWLWFLIGLLALWLITGLPNVDETTWSLMITYPLLGVGMSLIIYSLLQPGNGFIRMVIGNPVTGYLGKISYGLYVYHMAGLFLAYQITGRFIDPDRPVAYPVAGLFAGLVVTVLISLASYEMYEKPFLQFKDRFSVIESRKA